MATTTKKTRSGDEEEVVPNVHAEAYVERLKDPRYDDPTVATPGVLEDPVSDGTPVALVNPDEPSDLDATVDNRDQVQPVLDTLYEDALEQQEATPEQNAELMAERREARDSLADAPAPATKAAATKTDDK
jgi:hypothetical protein